MKLPQGLRLYFVVGERSGDLHAGNLIAALKKRCPDVVCTGFGGEQMQKAGMEVTTHYRELAFMGFAEVLSNLGTISKKIRQCKQEIERVKPDAIVLVDYAGFNLRIAKFAKENGYKVFWYISPKVWAWNQSRAKKLKANIDRMFVILPFETEFFEKFNWKVDYVGNPVLDAVKAHQGDKDFLTKSRLSTDKPLVALLPGSRKQELKQIIPVMARVAHTISTIQFVVAAVDNLDQQLYQPLRELNNVSFIQGETYDLLSNASAAIVTSGTATLETALFKVPQVVVYKTSFLSYMIAKNLIRVPFISLVNLIAGREVVKELIQGRANEKEVADELKMLLNDSSHRNKVIEGYNNIIRVLDTGSASENTATLMLRYLQPSNFQIE
ncbi:MAG: lipid-A-disaccharide synthase [Cyclobacteriaceae bacterium]|nr:lipid-A-disaccharide synthase [Cyclobacteriaceae bacterium]